MRHGYVGCRRRRTPRPAATYHQGANVDARRCRACRAGNCPARGAGAYPIAPLTSMAQQLGAHSTGAPIERGQACCSRAAVRSPEIEWYTRRACGYFNPGLGLLKQRQYCRSPAKRDERGALTGQRRRPQGCPATVQTDLAPYWLLVMSRAASYLASGEHTVAGTANDRHHPTVDGGARQRSTGLSGRASVVADAAAVHPRQVGFTIKVDTIVACG